MEKRAGNMFDGFSKPGFVESICHDAAAGSVVKAPFPEPAADADEAVGRIQAAVAEYLGYDHLEDTADDLIQLLGSLGDPDLRQWLAETARHAQQIRRKFSSPQAAGSSGPPPSEKQIRFLVKLGVRDFSGTKSEASALIDKLLKAREL